MSKDSSTNTKDSWQSAKDLWGSPMPRQYPSVNTEVDCFTPTTHGIATPTRTPTPTALSRDSSARSLCSRGSTSQRTVPSSSSAAETSPHAGQAFAIREHEGTRYITLMEGKLVVHENVGERGGWHWICAEAKGWFGFRSPVSATYIGHDANGNFWAVCNHHLAHESFCVRRHHEGGYVLLMPHEDTLMKMAISDSGPTLVETSGNGTRWDFIKVDKCCDVPS
ncbi:uncharacterized protein GGS25DRAFT_499859 [Hypoxylon fragiforme]|uniref:uncharacterized protein n=1 Tax=Hypoxylon fragiforme TaxID=63214 RepID=UPI0020C6155A|nr:uncharacterized protein GGS25DRAFT_499859 [Hypoxylon fragiforme]KAI2606172.1 hypothetical protein GGS25DRAFT_499859 [Hypoxylon fragiforme]